MVAIYESGRGDRRVAADFFRSEYRLNRRIFHYPMPYIALIDGIVMGGGVGVSVHGSHRIVTENTLFAMPETGIGLFPDVGGSHFLPRLPGQLGMFLGLTGTRLKAADCLYCGIATHYVGAEKLPALKQALAAADWRGQGPEAADAAIAGLATDPGPAPLAVHRDTIDRCFAAESVEGVLAALEAEGDDWAASIRATLLACSPTSLKVTFRQIRDGAALAFDDAMVIEYRLSQACVAGHDFLEGVRAAVIDKDRQPKWRPAGLADVDETAVAAHFAPLGGNELTFD